MRQRIIFSPLALVDPEQVEEFALGTTSHGGSRHLVEALVRSPLVMAPPALVHPDAVEAGISLPHWVAPDRARWLAGAVVARASYVIVALALFVLALELLKAGAGGLKPVLAGLSADGVAGLLGLGWVGSYLAMSGSPVAAIALSLFAGGNLSEAETFAMVAGSRLGASFIVLFVGFLYYLTKRRNPDGLYVGVVALLTAFTLWGPAVPIGTFVLREGWFDGVRFGSPGAVVSIVDIVSDPIVARADALLPQLALFGLGTALLLGSFAIFDRALPNLETSRLTPERLSRLFRQRFSMFAFGALVTVITLSVSLSLTMLVPLTLKGYVRRRQVVPYIMGANITTWIDTLFAALLLDSPRAFTVVFTVMAVGASISLLVLLVAYGPYSRVILALARRATASRRRFALFLLAILVVPALLLVA